MPRCVSGNVCNKISSQYNALGPDSEASVLVLVHVIMFYFCRFKWMLKLLQQLYTMGFRLISHEVNSAVSLTIKGNMPKGGYPKIKL